MGFIFFPRLFSNGYPSDNRSYMSSIQRLEKKNKTSQYNDNITKYHERGEINWAFSVHGQPKGQ